MLGRGGDLSRAEGGAMRPNGSGWVLGVLGLAAGLALGFVAARSGWFAPSRPASPEQVGERLPEPIHGAVPNPAERELLADLYVQTAAEYHALCLQTYRYAYECLLRRLKDPPAGELPFAVVMDLDE